MDNEAAFDKFKTCTVEVTSHFNVRKPSTSPDREVTATRSPLAAKARAMASPMPRLPPVTSTTRPAVMKVATVGRRSPRSYRRRSRT